jgi:hypothetical protein
MFQAMVTILAGIERGMGEGVGAGVGVYGPP